MNCPACQTPNPAQARFCLNCGSPLALACSNCGTGLPPGAKFCFNCGQAMAAPGAASAAPPVTPAEPPSPPSAAATLQQFIPRELLARLESARSSTMAGERRVVTMLFCDVKGSTAAASQLDPEEWAEVINGAFAGMIPPIYHYEGTVARLMGDGLLAFFGAPIAHEDDPHRAVLAGLEIVAAMTAYRQKVQQRWQIDFDVRVGINTGLVVVGAVGSDMRLEYTALGDAINLAARMEQTARPGTVQIAEPTYKLVAPLFDFEMIAELEVKGKAEPVRAYRVLGQKAEPGQVRGIAGLRARLVGRDREVAALQQALAALHQGSGQLVAVMGEAGLGKSRLVAELRDGWSASGRAGLLWVEGRSRSFETATPYAPFIDLLHNALGLAPLAAAPAAATHAYRLLQERLEALAPGQASETAPFLGQLLQVSLPPEDQERVRYLEPPLLRAAIFQAVTSLVTALAGQQPLVLFFDDVHWIDPTSLELLEQLLPLVERVPLMLILAFRPRRQEPSWRLHELGEREYAHRYTAIPLQPLDEAQSRELVGSLLHVEDLPASVRQLILEKAEGNPFFVEEVIRSLLDSGLVVRQDGHWRAVQEIANLTLPDTLVGVITARLDRLEETGRQVIQAAAVLGREFDYEALHHICCPPATLEDGLADLQRRQLVREKSRLPRRAYAFKHVLTQEAAYNSVLLSRRRELHRLAGEWLAEQPGGDPAAIARHFVQARLLAQAIPYLVEAGDQAAHNYAAAEALAFYRQVLENKKSVADHTLIRRAYEGMGSVLILCNQAPAAMTHYQGMLQQAEAWQDPIMTASALNKLAATAGLSLGQFAQAEQYLARAERLARQEEDASCLAEGAIIRCQMCTAMADFDSVVHHMSEVVTLSQQVGIKEYQVMGMEHVSESMLFLTRFDEAWERSQETVTMAREIGDRLHEAWALCTTQPYVLAQRGDLPAAQRILAEGVEIATRIGALPPQVYGFWLQAELARWQGRYEEALASAQRSLQAAAPAEPFAPFMVVQPLGTLGSVYLEISPQFGDKVADFHRHALRLLESPAAALGGGTAWADLGLCALAVGDLEIAGESFHKGLNVPSMFMWLERPRLLAGAALLAAREGRLDEAATQAENAWSYAEERRMSHLYPLLGLVRGQVMAARQQAEEATSFLQQAAEQGRKLGMWPIVWQAEANAGRLFAGMGQTAQAAASLAAAESVIARIGDHFTSEELRQAFLAQARAQLAL